MLILVSRLNLTIQSSLHINSKPGLSVWEQQATCSDHLTDNTSSSGAEFLFNGNGSTSVWKNLIDYISLRGTRNPLRQWSYSH